MVTSVNKSVGRSVAMDNSAAVATTTTSLIDAMITVQHSVGDLRLDAQQQNDIGLFTPDCIVGTTDA